MTNRAGIELGYSAYHSNLGLLLKIGSDSLDVVSHVRGREMVYTFKSKLVLIFNNDVSI